MSALFGIAAGVIVTAGWWLLYTLGLLTFPPFDLGDLVIRQSPGRFVTWVIETLGSHAQTAALTGSVVVWIGIGWGLFGLVIRLDPASRANRFVPLVMMPVALGLSWWSESGIGAARFLWFTVAFATSLAGGGVLLATWLVRLSEAQQESSGGAAGWLDQPGDYQRRELLRKIALVTLVVGAGGPILGRVLRSVGGVSASTSAGIPLSDVRAAIASPVSLPTPRPARPLPTDFSAPVGVRPRVTDNDEFYVVDISTRDPNPDEMGWVLRVHGLVEHELLVTWPDLLSMPSVELDGTLMCISYEHDNGLISTTRWTGVPLREVLARAGIRDGTVDLICRGANDYSDSIPLAKALEETTLLAYGMNGTALPRSHGFPCRLYVPGLYGEKNVKWLQEIELVQYDYRGFWQERGWTDIAIINTVSIIDTPRETVLLEGEVVPVGGIAFAGDRGVSGVQVRIDEGEWQDAMLEDNDPPLIWQRWRYDWQPQRGSYRIGVRAIDGLGAPQVEAERPPNPDGMTGLHSVTVDVV